MNEKVLLKGKFSSATSWLSAVFYFMAAISLISSFVYAIEFKAFWLFLIPAVFLILGLLLRLKYELSITANNVIGQTFFLWNVRTIILPIRQITAISTLNDRILTISSPSGVIHVTGILNQCEIVSCLSGLMNQQSNATMSNAAPQAQSTPPTLKTPAPATQSPATPATQTVKSIRQDDYTICGHCNTKNLNTRTTCWSCGNNL